MTAPSGHAAPLRCAGTSTASVPIQETSLTLRCGPVGPFHLNPQSLRDSPLLRGATPFQSLRDSPLLRGATPFLPPRRGTCRRPQACSLIGIRCNLNFVYNHAAPRHSPSRFVLCSRLAVYFNELNSSNSRIYKTKISVIPLNPMQFGMFPEYADTKMPREDHRQFPRGIP